MVEGNGVGAVREDTLRVRVSEWTSFPLSVLVL